MRLISLYIQLTCDMADYEVGHFSFLQLTMLFIMVLVLLFYFFYTKTKNEINKKLQKKIMMKKKLFLKWGKATRNETCFSSGVVSLFEWTNVWTGNSNNKFQTFVTYPHVFDTFFIIVHIFFLIFFFVYCFFKQHMIRFYIHELLYTLDFFVVC